MAAKPGQRVLNSADPDTPTAKQIVHAIGRRFGWTGTLDLLGHMADPQQGRHPWLTTHPIVLDTTAATQLGYVPVATGIDLLADEIDWVVAQHVTPSLRDF